MTGTVFRFKLISSLEAKNPGYRGKEGQSSQIFIYSRACQGEAH